MVKFPEAAARLYRNVYICKKCKSKVRTKPLNVLKGTAKCRKCGSKALRAVRRK